MAHHIISVSIFCFICATHSPCASHAVLGHIELYRHDVYKDPNIPKVENDLQHNTREKIKRSISSGINSHDDPIASLTNHDSDHKPKRSLDKFNGSTNKDMETEFLRKLFNKYGDGDIITIDGFKNMLDRLDLLQVLSKKLDENVGMNGNKEVIEVPERNITCLDHSTIRVLKQSTEQENWNHSSFSEICPILIYSILGESCSHNEEEQVFDNIYYGNNGMTWVYSILAVFVISICGVGALIIIPVMQKRFYKPLMQFLVALAVGTLAGDALLHLLPHAMGGSHEHGHHNHEEESGGHDAHLQNTWKGLVAMLGLIFFFIMERLILLISKWRKNRQKDKTVAHAHVKIYNDNGERRNSTQCMDKYNTSPYCYKDIMNDTRSKPDLQMKNSKEANAEKIEANQNVPDADSVSTPCIESRMLPRDHEDYTVIVREHGNDHHGHSHKHGHVHSAPKNYSSVAWMVIMGDGLHNFTDGMAIGAAFASGLAGGFSTTLAVFCHELPHELGDFAMLLKAGMSIKQALFYNLLCSGLCVLGNLVGLFLGNTETANSWLFAAAAGTFIYIALVDMIPELSSAHDEDDNLLQCFLHLSGLLVGVGIMAVIALYEHDLKHIFNEPE
ncbi:zinc transporter foi-like isoform X2 [Sitophilus oryzae]|uniref:Zinc transporter foi-like isoform X2 n=1 Tax=Sitophilus oryzae TaxID=7048 RepID=A0A6J2YSC5_SITOR|nr:zinc transporter foi-like isoform X2 [Sitophilus oryzae]